MSNPELDKDAAVTTQVKDVGEGVDIDAKPRSVEYLYAEAQGIWAGLEMLSNHLANNVVNDRFSGIEKVNDAHCTMINELFVLENEHKQNVDESKAVTNDKQLKKPQRSSLLSDIFDYMMCLVHPLIEANPDHPMAKEMTETKLNFDMRKHVLGPMLGIVDGYQRRIDSSSDAGEKARYTEHMVNHAVKSRMMLTYMFGCGDVVFKTKIAHLLSDLSEKMCEVTDAHSGDEAFGTSKSFSEVYGESSATHHQAILEQHNESGEAHGVEQYDNTSFTATSRQDFGSAAVYWKAHAFALEQRTAVIQLTGNDPSIDWSSLFSNTQQRDGLRSQLFSHFIEGKDSSAKSPKFLSEDEFDEHFTEFVITQTDKVVSPEVLKQRDAAQV